MKQIKKRLLASFTFAGLLLATGCRQPNPTQLRTEALTAPDTAIQAQAGQSFEVVLPSLGARPSYKWVLQSDYDKALLSFESERDASAEFGDRPPQDYAPNRIFSFKAIALGNTELRFTQEALDAKSPAVTSERRHKVQIQAALTPASPSPIP